MDRQILQAMREHAQRDYPREACGLVVVVDGRGKYVPCRNAAEGSEHFILPAEDYAAAEDMGEIVAVVHSHPDVPAQPSEADLVSCEASGLPWHILSWPADDLRTIVPSGYEAPLVGRQFSHGVLDCYTLIRDWYRRERCIDLPDFARRDDWWKSGEDLYMRHYAEAGFVAVSQDQPEQAGDVILMQLRAKVANHAGIYLGDGHMLHHLHDRLSSRDVYGGYWQEITRCVLRYKGL
ncbi:C40 family peptidase [Cupriavidus plantarum]|uniref:C40 family peptidase n=1 Tax=Cupriavidus plantarum TaxID=942865 RepID=UPI000EADDC34|nr:C40 family peptidase [Cupriavidus plantarum]RLK45941.1 proteasome lid subunit RPN8/RPN11 [Cupriavidus plantarum]